MSTIILTGANGNLGIPVTEKLLQEGHRLISVTGPEGAGEMPEDPSLENRAVDLMQDQQTKEFVDSVIQKYPGIDAAVLLVGGFAMGRLADTKPEQLDKMIRLNFHTAFHVVRHLLPYFLESPQGGQFILVGSRPGMNPAEGTAMFAYSLGKSMVFRLAEFINAEGKGKNVSATVIVPSTIDTPDNRQAMPDADFTKWVPPANIAEAISFSLSETGRMMKETVLRIYNRS